MVTFAQRISEFEPRRSRRLPGSPCTLAAQHTTAVKSLHRDHLSRFYPQGSTAIPACEMNHPGAAALTRHPASAKFRPASGASGRLNINGANTYQFVMSNPAGNMDVWGTAAAQCSRYLRTNGRLAGPICINRGFITRSWSDS